MALKYNFTITETGVSPVDVFLWINKGYDGFYVYSLLFIIMGVLSYVFIRKLNDVQLGLMFSGWITFLCMIVLYYLGLEAGVTVINATWVFGAAGIIAFAMGLMYFDRFGTRT